jgi:predicted MPP superfamily phosphohydrolase
MYVSRGVGTAHVPLRMAAPPEIAVLTLRRP